MARPKMLVLFCGQGGGSMGYWHAGFDVVGVDIEPQPRYPFEFVQADAMTLSLGGFDVIHTSPPCQRYSRAQKLRGYEHPDLIASVRDMLDEIGLPYIIENVPYSPLLDPIELCGAMFDLGTYRHRLFETNWQASAPSHPSHLIKTTKMGRKPVEGEFMHVVGHFTGIEKAKRAMGIDWMTRDGLAQAIPPAYTEYIGKQLLAHLAAA